MISVKKDYPVVWSPNGLAERLSGYQRRRMYDRFIAEVGIDAADTVLDVGVTEDRSHESSNYLERWYPYKAMITALGLEDAGFLQDHYPGLRFVRATGLSLPFRERSFEVVHSSAVLEHVGSLANQIAFVQECCRVARKAVFLTTPNRWFPLEFHTVMPLVHWFPKQTFRALMRALGWGFFAEEANLNLLSGGDLRRIAASVKGYAFKVSTVSLGGWPSNLLLIGRRKEAKPY
jgi:Methyltransferase domain